MIPQSRNEAITLSASNELNRLLYQGEGQEERDDPVRSREENGDEVGDVNEQLNSADPLRFLELVLEDALHEFREEYV